MPITAANLEFRLSGGAGNANPNASLGGVMSSTVIPSGTLHNLFDVIDGAEAAGAQVDNYRCIYVRNGHGSLTWFAPRVWVATLSTSPDTEIALALAGEGVGVAAEVVADETTPPSGEVFSTPTTKAGGLVGSDVPSGSFFAIWVRRRKNAAAGAFNDHAVLQVEGDTNP